MGNCHILCYKRCLSLVYGLSLCLKTQQEAISQREIVFRFRKDTQSLRKAGVLMIFLREKSWGEGNLCSY